MIFNHMVFICKVLLNKAWNAFTMRHGTLGAHCEKKHPIFQALWKALEIAKCGRMWFESVPYLCRGQVMYKKGLTLLCVSP